jgi:competence protein ComFC
MNLVRAAMNALLPTRCPLCTRYLTASEIGICAACLGSIPDATLEGHLLHLGNYHGALERAARALKFAKNREVAVPLAAKLAAGIVGAGWRADAVVPLPIHAARARVRTYNQSEVIAKHLAQRLRIPVLHALQRTRATYTQARLERSEREQNVKGAFLVTGTVAGLELLLLDDVYTSGATATEATYALIEAGAKRVRVVTLARATNARQK